MLNDLLLNTYVIIRIPTGVCNETPGLQIIQINPEDRFRLDGQSRGQVQIMPLFC